METAALPYESRVTTRPTVLHTRVVADRTVAGEIWRGLEALLGSTGLANSWVWTDCWLEAYGATVPHWFVVAERNGNPVGVTLVTRGRSQRRGPLPLRTIHIGTSGEEPGRGVWVEYNRLLVTDADREAFWQTLLSAPGAARLSVDAVALDGFDPDEVPAAIRADLVIREKPCFVSRLNATATLLESFDGDTRRKVRKGSKRFAEAFGPLRTEWIEAAPRALAVLDELIGHHQARWNAAGKPGAFADPRFVAFHRLLIERGLPDGRVVVARVSAGETLVGIFYGFVEADVMYHYQWGLPAFEDSALAPGFITGFLVMEEAKRRGFGEVNWLAGDSRYKRDLSNARRSLIWAEKGRSPWHGLITRLIEIYGRLPESGKRTMRSQR